MTKGVSLNGVADTNWKEIDSETGAGNNVPKMGLIAWNLVIQDEPLMPKKLSKAGIIFLIRDIERAEVPGLSDAIRSGLIVSEGETDLEMPEPQEETL